MGIYVKGMEMPESCSDCNFCVLKNFGPDENEYNYNICFLTTDRVDDYYKARPAGCPLQEVKED